MDLCCVSTKDSNTLVKTNKEILNASFFEQVQGLPGNSAIIAASNVSDEKWSC